MKDRTVDLTKRYYIPVLIFFFATALYISYHVTLQGDDYIYRQAAACRFSRIVQFLKWHYENYNGRTLVHLIDILMLKFSAGEYVWKIVCPLLMCIYCVVVSKICNRDNNFGVVLAVFSIVSVNPCFWNESIYWMTGSFNYFFPNLLFLTMLMIFRENPKSKWLLPLTVVCAFTVEQVCMMALGFWLLMLIDKLITERKFYTSFFVRIFVCIIGIASIVFLSKSGKRMGEFNTGFLGNVFNNLKTIWFGNLNMALLIIATLVVSSVWIFRLTNKKGILIPVWVLAVCNYALKAVSMLTEINFSHSFNIVCTVMLCCFAVLYCITALTAGVLIYKNKKEWLPLTAVILAFGAQLMLGVENYLIYRTGMPTIFMLSIYVIYSILSFEIKAKFLKPLFAVVCILTCFVHGYIAPKTLIIQEKIDVKPLTDAQLSEFESYTEKYGSAFVYAKKDKFTVPDFSNNFDWTFESLTDFSDY